MVNELKKLSECVIKENNEDLINSVNENFANILSYFNNIVKYNADIRLSSPTFKSNNLNEYLKLKKDYELEIKSSYKKLFDSINEINRICDNYNTPRIFYELKLPESLINKDRNVSIDFGIEFILTMFEINEKNKKSEELKKFSPSILQKNVTETTSNIRSTKK